MLSDPQTIEPSLDLILVSRHLERIGDHATNIAEDVIFMVSARDVRHHVADHVGEGAGRLDAPHKGRAALGADHALAQVKVAALADAIPLGLFVAEHDV